MTAADAASRVSSEQQAKGSNRGLWIALALFVLAGGGGAGAWFGGFIGKGQAPAGAEAQKPPLYFSLDDHLVVNFRKPSGARYLEVGIELMTRDPKTLEALKTQTPVIRNNLILLLSDQTYDNLATREGKEALRAAALAEVRSAVGETEADAGVESLYFTTFVMQ